MAANIEAITIESGYITIRTDSGPPQKFPTLTGLTTQYRASLTGGSTGAIGNYVDVTQPVVSSGWALAYFGSVQLTCPTQEVVGSAAGGVFEVNMTSAFAGSTSGIVCGLFVGAYGNSASDMPTCGLWIETIVGSGLSFAADGSPEDMPILALVTSGAGIESSLAIEFGSEMASKQVTTGAGGMFHNQTIQVKVNGTLMYWPLSTVEGTFTTAYPIVLAEDVELRFGGGTVADGVIASWTGEELVFTSLHPCDAASSFRTVLIDTAIDMYAGCDYAALSSMTWLSGTGATWATAVHGMLEQDATLRVTGYMMAGYFEIKNAADNCSTASAINLRWDNDSNVGFGGVMHSFIRFEDNSPTTKVNNLFELYLMDMTTGAAADEIVCQVGAANTPSHCIKISANGVPYWILASSTPPA